MTIDSLSSSDLDFFDREFSPENSTAAYPSMREGLARGCFGLSQHLRDPFGWALLKGVRIFSPLQSDGKPLSLAGKVKEIAIRAFYGVAVSFLAIPTLLPLLLGIAIQYIGTKLRANEYSYWEGKGPEKALAELDRENNAFKYKVMSCDAHVARGMPLTKERIEEVAREIKAENPDVICFYQFWEPHHLKSLVKELEGDFAHFYGHNGTTGFSAFDSGLLIVSKFPISDFSFTRFQASEGVFSNKGFASFRISTKEGIPLSRIVATDLQFDASAKTRHFQMTQIIDHLSQIHLQGKEQLPMFFCGDTKTMRGSPEYNELFTRYFNNGLPNADKVQEDPLQKKSINAIALMHRCRVGDEPRNLFQGTSFMPTFRVRPVAHADESPDSYTLIADIRFREPIQI